MSKLVTAGICAVIFAISLCESRYQAIWYDEIYTEAIGQAGGISGIMSALAGGTDLNPPLCYVAVSGSMKLLGPSLLALRLPSAVGYLLMSLGIYVFVSRRYPAPTAWLAMLLPTVTKAFQYSHEGRPYGIFLGFSCLMLVCWQSATWTNAYRRWAIVGLLAALVAAISTHYYAVFLSIPIAIAELIRTRETRRWDLGIWLALGLGCVSLLAYLPLISASRAYSATFWSKPSIRSLDLTYSTLLIGSAPALVLLLLAGSLFPKRAIGRDSCEGFETAELGAAIMYALFPLIAILAARALRLGYTPRYSLPATIGLCVLLAAILHERIQGRVVTAFAILLLIGCVGSHFGSVRGAFTGARKENPWSHLADQTALANDLDIAIPSGIAFLEASRSQSGLEVARFIFVSHGPDTATLGLKALSRMRPMRIEESSRYLQSNAHFLLVDDRSSDSDDWLMRELIDRKATILMKSQDSHATLHEVIMPKP